ncbi:hypothetical protein AcV5_010253 [Taiwanofungus camphoratus]|nr:hypothetical protein AcV5_010253 [Antrodia cinnamomea]
MHVSLQWDIVALENGYYKFKIGNASVGEKDHLLWAFLAGVGGEGDEWIISYHERYNAYIIKKVSEVMLGLGWKVASAEPETQIAVSILIVDLSIPPTFSLNELWTILCVNED